VSIKQPVRAHYAGCFNLSFNNHCDTPLGPQQRPDPWPQSFSTLPPRPTTSLAVLDNWLCSTFQGQGPSHASHDTQDAPHLLDACPACPALLCLSHVTVTHTTAAPDDGDKPYTALDSIFSGGYSGYLSSSDRVKYFQGMSVLQCMCDKGSTLAMALASGPCFHVRVCD
jgi:hypothetical protein